ncbi:MAG: hypothetical protein EOO41_01795 [Methanobacteriota archaeon]|nr:MAG: hypothetical protein EOO41_01795 [Euryarchaeota archaeon]
MQLRVVVGDLVVRAKRAAAVKRAATAAHDAAPQLTDPVSSNDVGADVCALAARDDAPAAARPVAAHGASAAGEGELSAAEQTHTGSPVGHRADARASTTLPDSPLNARALLAAPGVNTDAGVVRACASPSSHPWQGREVQLDTSPGGASVGALATHHTAVPGRTPISVPARAPAPAPASDPALTSATSTTPLPLISSAAHQASTVNTARASAALSSPPDSPPAFLHAVRTAGQAGDDASVASSTMSLSEIADLQWCM